MSQMRKVRHREAEVPRLVRGGSGVGTLAPSLCAELLPALQVGTTCKGAEGAMAVVPGLFFASKEAARAVGRKASTLLALILFSQCSQCVKWAQLQVNKKNVYPPWET